MARVRNQDARRAQIIEAAGRRIAERGSRDLRVQDIAEAAGVSPNTVRYYYTDLDKLLVEVHRVACDHFAAARLAAVQDLPDPVDKLACVVHYGTPDSPTDYEWRLLQESSKVASSDDLYPILRMNLYHRQVALYSAVLREGNESGAWSLDADEISRAARALVALEDKLGVLVMWDDPAITPAVARDIIRDYAERVTGAALSA